MAALLPPPKRQKVYHGIEPPVPELPVPVPNVVVQFVSEEDGQPLAPAVSVPADFAREGLELLVNKLSKQVYNLNLLSALCLILIDMRRTRTPCRFRSMSHYPHP